MSRGGATFGAGRLWLAAAICASALSLSPVAGAQPEPRRERAPVAPTAVKPDALPIYPPDDPLAELKMRVETLMGIYLVDPPRRHDSERVVLEGGRVRLDVWHPVARASNAELQTRAVEWFLLGRTQYAPGVGGVFSELPAVAEVVMIFHEVIRPQTGRRRSDRPDEVKRYLMIRLTRARFERLRLDAAEECVSQGDCARVFRRAFDEVRFDSRYTARARASD